MSNDVHLKIDGLEKLAKALKAKPPVARVGILGSKATRSGDAHAGSHPSNATIGAAHEFGTSKSPQRSFLRGPISARLNKRLEATGALDQDSLRKVIAGGSLTPWIKLMGIEAEGIVLEAFDTGGFGEWTPSDFRRKKNHQTLVETQQLRNSITSEVAE